MSVPLPMPLLGFVAAHDGRSLKALASPTFQVEPAYLGLHEENSPDRRLLVMANARDGRKPQE